ncbi:hypothetical protein [Brevibacterium jeotgali]|uniref:Uncharacterized protein n=1 Tax=Brevibacterium jeotgali TaxID=1262550 RepID=A0A2H1L1Q1_9MICO|nr:hypothetical protein [Brevibacterium jeotgali]SMY10802.1 hypothetical protein BJEO58_00377 [Brevibacterium jeotgali]
MREELHDSNQKVFSALFLVGISATNRDALDQYVQQALTGRWVRDHVTGRGRLEERRSGAFRLP